MKLPRLGSKKTAMSGVQFGAQAGRCDWLVCGGRWQAGQRSRRCAAAWRPIHAAGADPQSDFTAAHGSGPAHARHRFAAAHIALPAAPMAPRAAPPFAQAVPMVPAGHVALAVAARYGRDAPPIGSGLIWRVYAAKPDATGVFRLVKEDRPRRRPSCCRRAITSCMPASDWPAPPRRCSCARNGARSARHSRRRHAAGRPRRRRAHSDRTDIVRHLSGSQFDAAERRPIAQNVMTGDVVLLAGRHLLHRVELRRRQFGGALRRARRSRPSSPISW